MLLFGNALWLEYQDLLDRPVWGDAATAAERHTVPGRVGQAGALGNGVLRLATQLRDEGGNHLIELALAGGAAAIVTHNLRDLKEGELRLGNLRVLTPAQCLEDYP